MPMWECNWAFVDEDGARVQRADRTTEPGGADRRGRMRGGFHRIDDARHRVAAILASGGHA